MELNWTDDDEPAYGSGEAAGEGDPAAAAAAKEPTKEREYPDDNLVAGLRYAMGQVAAGDKPSSGTSPATPWSAMTRGTAPRGRHGAACGLRRRDALWRCWSVWPPGEGRARTGAATGTASPGAA